MFFHKLIGQVHIRLRIFEMNLLYGCQIYHKLPNHQKQSNQKFQNQFYTQLNYEEQQDVTDLILLKFLNIFE